MSQFVWTFPGGKNTDNYVVKGTAAAAGKGDFSEDEDEHRIVIATGKAAMLYGGVVTRDVSATVVIQIFNSTDKLIFSLISDGAATGDLAYPHDLGNSTRNILKGDLYPIPLKAGDYIKFLFGAQQAATAAISAVILEVDAP